MPLPALPPQPTPVLRAPCAGAVVRLALAGALALAAWSAAVRPAHAQVAPPNAGASTGPECPALLRHSFERLQDGTTQSLCDFRGQVLLVVNTASQCGYTRQYEGLEALYRRYRDRGLVVLGFPSNDFGGQEPGSNAQIAQFCRTAFGIAFPMFGKSSVAGPAGNPLFRDLAARSGQRPAWNFHKYLIDRRGETVASFPSAVEPDSRELAAAIERLLARSAPAGRG